MIFAATLRGVEGRVVEVTAKNARSAVPAFQIRGLSPAAEREARVRVQVALANSDVALHGDTEVRCETSSTSLDGCALDLPIALAIAGGALGDVGAIGELSLGGEVRPVRGALPMVEALKGRVGVVIVARENAQEAALVDGVRVIAVKTLREALMFARGALDLPSTTMNVANARAVPGLDMCDIRGQERGRRALEIAAAGNHNILFVGAPGAGKTMFARRLPGLLPVMTPREALEVTRIHSAAGLNVGGALVESRPFRAPHHSTTPPGLVGGGSLVPRPGEVTLAHQGVLFLDELPEFSRVALEVLDDPIASGEVLLARASGTVRFPARALLVASMSPCPCDRFGHPSNGPRCRCDENTRQRYLARLPPRLLRRIELRVRVDPVEVAALEDQQSPEASATIRQRVVDARERLLTGEKLSWEASCARPLARAADATGTYERALKVARTIAALAESTTVTKEHVEEALTFTRDVSEVVCGS